MNPSSLVSRVQKELVALEEILLEHFGPLSTYWLWRTHWSWPRKSVYDHAVAIFRWPLPAGYWTMSQSSNELKLLSWTWQWAQWTYRIWHVIGPVRSGHFWRHGHQISIQWSTFGMWWKERLPSWRCRAASAWLYNMEQNVSSWNVSSTFLNLCHKHWRFFFFFFYSWQLKAHDWDKWHKKGRKQKKKSPRSVCQNALGTNSMTSVCRSCP